MRRTCFPSLLRRSLTIAALAATLMSAAWAKPRFKILHTVPGGLFTGLTFDAKGNLYGVTSGGGDSNHGTIFELAPGTRGWTLTTLHSFDGQDGGSPNGGLIFDAARNLYGTSPSGGTGYDGGNVFEMTPGSGGWTFNVLYNFCLQYHCPDGGNPSGGLVMDGRGNLYGGAGGGTYGAGVVFELTSGSGHWDESVLYNFEGVQTGFGPSGLLIFDAAGNLYGTTVSGGKTSSSCYFGCGTVFKLRDTSGQDWKERLLYDFHRYDGQAPFQGVVFDGSGNLYGTTYAGGRSKACIYGSPCGTVFKLTRDASGRWKETVLYDFPTAANGSTPSSVVVFDEAGNLYGTTAGGGDSSCTGGCGVVNKLAPTATGKWKYTVLHKFTGQDGGYPDGGVVMDDKGNLYGTAYNVVYEITP